MGVEVRVQGSTCAVLEHGHGKASRLPFIASLSSSGKAGHGLKVGYRGYARGLVGGLDFLPSRLIGLAPKNAHGLRTGKR